MRKRAFLAFFIIIPFSSFASATSKPVVSQNNNLPLQVSKYYSNYNFVSLFSSELERELITDSLMCKGVLGKPDNPHLNSSFDFCDEIPEMPGSERLGRISALITELNEHLIKDTTDKMAIQEYIPGAGFHMRRNNPEVMPLLPNPYSVPPRLFKVNRVSLSGDSATVEVTVYQLDPETNARLISQYKRYGSIEKGNPNSEQLIRLAVPSAIFSREYHQWVLDNDRWQRFEASTALIRK
jgi:hypothetical protein